jgi:hypothetical protein
MAKRARGRTVGLTAVLLLGLAGPVMAAKGKDKDKGKPAKEDPVARGGYIVAHSGCNDCHTPWVFNKELNMPVPDMTRMLSGHPATGSPDSATKINPKTDLAIISADFTAFTLPFGTVYAANLTPDKETGLGNWTEEMFVKSIKTGMHMGAQGRVVLPPMPWPDIRNLTDDDVKAVFAYLKTVPPIRNPVADPKVPPPVLDAMMKSRPKMIEMLESGHKGPPPTVTPAPDAGTKK